MRLYNSMGPNPYFIRMVLAEKKLETEVVDVDILAGENRQPPFLSLNPTGTTPVLVTDSGLAIAETLAICEYLDECFPRMPLMGADAEARARVRMGWRRVELGIVLPMTAGFRGAEGLALFRDRVPCYPASADAFKQAARQGLLWLEQQLDGTPFLLGSTLTAVDLLLFSFLEFGDAVGQGVSASTCPALSGWQQRMRDRPVAMQVRGGAGF